MNQKMIGEYIAKKRKAKNLTQMMLGERLGVSYKTVSKWENAKCMPDYSIVESLCQELGITITELMNGCDDQQLHDNQALSVDLLKRIQHLEQQKNLLYGFLLMIMGILMIIVSYFLKSRVLTDFFSGLLKGIGIGDILIGVCFKLYMSF